MSKLSAIAEQRYNWDIQRLFTYLFDLFAAKKLQTVRSEICPAIAISAIKCYAEYMYQCVLSAAAYLRVFFHGTHTPCSVHKSSRAQFPELNELNTTLQPLEHAVGAVRRSANS